jgi:8-oxo-dGTP pyrophosphatase MutT (NUDIX family)
MERIRQLELMLTRYRPHDADEAAHVDRLSALLATPGDPFCRDRFDPGHVTASALILSPAEDALLLILHARLGRWLQPGGHVEPHDLGTAETAIREAEEETGLRGLAPGSDPATLFDVDVHTIPARPGQQEHLHFDVRFLFRAADGTSRPGSDARAARWVALEALDRPDGEPSMRRILRKLATGPRAEPRSRAFGPSPQRRGEP